MAKIIELTELLKKHEILVKKQNQVCCIQPEQLLKVVLKLSSDPSARLDVLDAIVATEKPDGFWLYYLLRSSVFTHEALLGVSTERLGLERRYRAPSLRDFFQSALLYEERIGRDFGVDFVPVLETRPADEAESKSAELQGYYLLRKDFSLGREVL